MKGIKLSQERIDDLFTLSAAEYSEKHEVSKKAYYTARYKYKKANSTLPISAASKVVTPKKIETIPVWNIRTGEMTVSIASKSIKIGDVEISI